MSTRHITTIWIPYQSSTQIPTVSIIVSWNINCASHCHFWIFICLFDDVNTILKISKLLHLSKKLSSRRKIVLHSSIVTNYLIGQGNLNWEGQAKLKQCLLSIDSRLSRCSAARGSRTGLVTVFPAKVRLVILFYSLKVPLN